MIGYCIMKLMSEVVELPFPLLFGFLELILQLTDLILIGCCELLLYL